MAAAVESNHNMRCGTVGRAPLLIAGHSLAEAFNSLEYRDDLKDMIRYENNGVRKAGVRCPVENRAAKGYWEFIRLDKDFHLLIYDMTYRHKKPIFVPGEDFIEFHARFAGTLSLELSESNTLNISGDRLLIWNQPQGCNITEYIHGAVRDVTFTIFCRRSMLERYFGDYARQVLRLLRYEESIGYLSLPLNPSLSLRIRNIIDTANNSSLPPRVRLVSLEAQSIEILCQFLPLIEQYGGSPDMPGPGSMSERDLSCLRDAREILASQYTRPPSIPELARQVGMSATKLKSGFRGLFGDTIHGYTNKLRMKEAQKLLTQSELPIHTVSQLLGYEHHNGFTLAFRKHFGLPPKQYRTVSGDLE